QSWNRGAEVLYGYPAASASGKSLGDLILPAHLAEENDGIMERIRAGKPVPQMETVRRRQDESLVPVSLAVGPVFDADGVAVGASVTSHDITEEKRTDAIRIAQERQALEMRQLKALDTMRIDFMNEASHELNTPLTPMMIQLHVLLTEVTLDAKQRKIIEVIERNVQRLALLVKDMLDASRLQAGRIQLKITSMDLMGPLTDAVTSCQKQAEQAGLDVQLESGPPLPVCGSEAGILQIMDNLLSNAIKYTQRGGHIRITTTGKTDFATVSVTDTGLGLSAEQRGALFRPFGRVHEGMPGLPFGTGLGLFIAKGLVAQQGGTMWAESGGPGEGSTFSFTIPISVDSTPVIQRGAHAALRSSGPEVATRVPKREQKLAQPPSAGLEEAVAVPDEPL
ncbi:MAG: PAS domain-containing sensor histidine kinase, partial [Thermoplasmatota archaeon]